VDPTQSDLIRGRVLRVALGAGADHTAAPTDGTTEPDWRMSPVTPTGLKTTGFAFGFKAPTAGATAAGAPAAGFTVVVWVRNPVTKSWFSLQSVSVGYGQLFGTFDVDAAEIYFQISAQTSNGSIDVHPMEQ
jgi:hypothetical protein